MATLGDIKARIKTVGNIKKITKAMQLVAAAKLHKAQDRAHMVRPYADQLDGILGALSAGGSTDEAGDTMVEMNFVDDASTMSTTREKLFSSPDAKRIALVLFTSDRGLCGAFNTNLIRGAQKFLNDSALEVQLVTVGRKGNQYFRRRADIVHHVEGLDDKLDLQQIKAITGKLIEMYINDEVDEVHLMYAQSGRTSGYTVTTQQFLPIPPIEAKSGGTDDNYIMEPDRDQLFASLIPLYATTSIFSVVADSFASEYGAKMAAMQLATKNASEKESELILLRNRLRQAAITKELAEIVGGAEALK
jgi:F-type H+-transporting ATPase subunit gamma